MKPRTQVSLLWPVGVQPMNCPRLVASANSAVTAFSTTVLYCSTPRSDVTTVAAPRLAKFAVKLSVSSSLTLTSYPNTSRTAFRSWLLVKRRRSPGAGAKAGGFL